MMKIPALRAKIGIWDYYVATLTFEQVLQFVSRVDDELHKSTTLKELIQRSITVNYLSIKTYILSQPELFFNSLVLAVYDDYPDWKEIEVTYDGGETFQMGLLDFPGTHKIFPVDGQHRVEGIKAALAENPALANEQISVIFIGHKNDEEGMQKTRRLFSTLNRYAKPVTMDDIIALDEDDSIAIVTRSLLEEHILFKDRRVTKSKNKAIPNDDKKSFTSIITLYDCNKELLKYHRRLMKINFPDAIRDKKSFAEYLKIRPSTSDLEKFTKLCFDFWSAFVNSFDFIQEYLISTATNPAEHFRNNVSGGNLLFRPVGLFPFVQACLEIHENSELEFSEVFSLFKQLDLSINHVPWKQVVWSEYENKMIMGNQVATKLLLKFLSNQELSQSELKSLKVKYSSALAIPPENMEQSLDNIKG